MLQSGNACLKNQIDTTYIRGAGRWRELEPSMFGVQPKVSKVAERDGVKICGTKCHSHQQKITAQKHKPVTL